jgi:hypothetical protein
MKKGNSHLHFYRNPQKIEDVVQFYQYMPFAKLEPMNIGKNPFERLMVEQQSSNQFLASILQCL